MPGGIRRGLRTANPATRSLSSFQSLSLGLCSLCQCPEIAEIFRRFWRVSARAVRPGASLSVRRRARVALHGPRRAGRRDSVPFEDKRLHTLRTKRYRIGKTGGAIATFMNRMWKFTACAVVLGCAMVLSGVAYARGGGGGGFHGGGGFYGGRSSFYSGRVHSLHGGRGSLQGGRGSLQVGRGFRNGVPIGGKGGGGFHNGVPIGGQGGGGFHNGVPISGQGGGGFHNGVPIGGRHMGEGGHRGHHPDRRHHHH